MCMCGVCVSVCVGVCGVCGVLSHVCVASLLTSISLVRDAGIPEMLDVDDMVSVKIPDAKSIMTFLVTIYQHFN